MFSIRKIEKEKIWKFFFEGALWKFFKGKKFFFVGNFCLGQSVFSEKISRTSKQIILFSIRLDTSKFSPIISLENSLKKLQERKSQDPKENFMSEKF